MEFIDLFCGSGLFSEGMVQAGHTPVASYDSWPLAIKSYRKNHKVGMVWDIMKAPLDAYPNVDIIIGSPPCTDFSTANNKRQYGTTLIDRMLEIVEYIKPKYWIMENVPKVADFLPYVPNVQIYSACNFGANQLRRRLFAGRYVPILIPYEKSHKVASMTGALARHRFTTRKDSAYMSVLRLQRYFGFKNPSIKRLKYEMGLRSSYIIYGTYNQKVMQLVNGVYVPIARALGEALD